MASIARRQPRTTNIWPGFVDALAALLIVVIFLLMVFVLSQVFLNQALSGRDAALASLQGRVSELAELLGLERQANADLSANLRQLSQDLQASLTAQEELAVTVGGLTRRTQEAERRADELAALLALADRRAADAEADGARLRQALADASATIAGDRVTLDNQRQKLAKLARDVAALGALKAELERQVEALDRRAGDAEGALVREREISEEARAQLALLNRQMEALRAQLAQLNAALEASEAKAEEQRVQIVSLGQRLNAALAGKVQELARYRSEFFGRLREVLGDQPDIRIVGDRFVFQSEVLFASGSAELDDRGRDQLKRVAASLNELRAQIPADIPWILQVNGHTDRVPIGSARFASNRELAAARALSVVELFIAEGIPPERLAAAGFGEFHPLEPGDGEEAFRRNRRIELKLTQP